ncbi:uncharacterized protein LOC34621384 [Cyclospora cayetanensis]|uniref:Uncharacterized protein LOC34621384 n=1 Tax=Cyclospora cayetanensis TaxID=88456 RepID=A0A6P5WD01_9EIME|nr:uncharacterized protein LOC34621384 [Cyclospora cayetanensis]
MEAGLGGGSSNAATLLHAADVLLTKGHFSQEPQQKEALSSSCVHEGAQPPGSPSFVPSPEIRFSSPGMASLISLQLGADVPFFLNSDGAAICLGRGEQVRCCSQRMPVLLQRAFTQQQDHPLQRPILQGQPPLQVFVLKGSQGLSTKSVFEYYDNAVSSNGNNDNNSREEDRDISTIVQWLTEEHTSSHPTTNAVAAAPTPEPPEAVIQAFRRCALSNDLLSAATRLQPQVAAVATALRSMTAPAAGQQQARQRLVLQASGLTGSGAALVGIGKGDAAAAEVGATAAALGVRAYKCTPLYKRPLSCMPVSLEPNADADTQEQVQHLWFAPEDLAERLQ